MSLIFLIEDDKGLRENLSYLLKEENFNVSSFSSAEEAEKKIKTLSPDIVITDLKLPGMNGIEFVSSIKKNFPYIQVIIITAYATLESAVEALRLGARDYLIKPFPPEKIIFSLKHIQEEEKLKEENLWLKEKISRMEKFEEMIGKSSTMQKIYSLIEKVAKTDVPVLITGESGTGKELVAKAIHKRSPRRKEKFVPVNCSAIPGTIIESEMFGYEKGAFTGATERKKGLLEISDKGTLLFDEIGDLPLSVQMKLLRFLQEREFLRVGGTNPVKVDTRVISATNKNLEEEIKRGNFREDLYYRIQGVIITLPSLREKKEDIPLLLNHFLKKYKYEGKGIKKKFTKESVEMLMRYNWPGNVRELENVVRACITLSDGEIIGVEDLPEKIRIKKGKEKDGTLKEVHEKTESNYIMDLLKKTGGNISRASRIAGISRRHFYEKMKKYGIKK